MTRRFNAGASYEFSGVRFRISEGRKSEDDLVLEWNTGPGGWRRIEMSAVAFMTDFFFDNEEALYPPPAAGGRKFLGYLNTAGRWGWERADSRLQDEKRRKAS